MTVTDKINRNKKKYRIQALIVIILIFFAFIGSFLIADYVQTNELAQDLLMRYGPLGAMIVAFIAGLNLIVPVPAATFVPIFTAAGLSVVTIIILFIIGTTLADLLAYVLGRMGKNFLRDRYPEAHSKVEDIYKNKVRFLPYFVFFWASFVPLPNEAILIPLGLLGVKMRAFIIPLLLGTTLYISLFTLGTSTVFEYVQTILDSG